ncbi:MAG: inorganic triphosphatase [Ewingella americana]|jgi:triphosphatase|uniref:CYTH domain-containing protein n=1 Tax=Ewingella americana TaxID=41202 RepID=UPI000C2FECD2|nr:inorganic triphosphatase [Ewingella americana]MCI1679553.1 inorganic triphosphatase [Ewingella americana]MCI1854880.1 inorganic triphosphatase [Ewingella americana]MCI1861837.1 inorganic triphosphatase [Ewingella americana]MCI2141688.1 inorganic triphosphatase [Ewingella americana]MCI2164392.1 inorganic triphosphatase [Ewingella americana]
MTVEIELKFIATAAAIAELPEQLAQFSSEHSAPQKLTNIYYETADNWMRSHDMGLRIRGFDDQYEMTIKTAGSVVGGLHQRPEYNVELKKPTLKLSAFPKEIWPEGCKVAALQKALLPLFSTNFMREKWVITYQQSEIELGLDQGEVVAGELSEPLAEIELELKSGNTADLLALAALIGQNGGLRQGGLSKAARGYHLAKGNPARESRPLPVFKAAPKATVEQAMEGILALALDQWQYHEELWVRGDKAVRLSVLQAVEAVRQTLVLFGGLIPRKASTELRALLTDLLPALEQKGADAQAVCYSPAYLKCKLALTSWLATQQWKPFIDEKAQKKLDGSFKRFADIMLGRTAADLKEAFGQPLDEDGFRDQLARLKRQIISFHMLAGAYSHEEYSPYINGWLELQQAIIQQQHAWEDSARQHAVMMDAFWLNGKVK